MHRLACLVGLIATLSLLGCGGGDDSGNQEGAQPKPLGSPPAEKEDGGKPVGSAPGEKEGGGKAVAGFTGTDAENYEIAKMSCGAFSQEEVAKDLGMPASADAVEIAEEFASGYQPAYQQAVFEGCLAGLP